MKLWIKCKNLSWNRFPDLEKPFVDFVRNIEWKGYYTPEQLQSKGRKWDEIQVILTGAFTVLRIQLSAPFTDFNKL